MFTTLGNIIFGIHDYSGVIITGIFGLLTLYLTFLIGRKIIDNKTGLLAALILAATNWHIYFSKSVLPNTTFTFFFCLTILFYIYSLKDKGNLYLILTAACLIATYLVRTSAIMLFGIIGLHELYMWISKSKKFKTIFTRILLLILITAPPIAAIMLTYQVMTPENAQYFTTAQTDNAGGFLDMLNPEKHNFRYYLKSIVDLTSPATVILLILGMLFFIKNQAVLYSWFLFVFIFLSIFPHHRLKLFVPALPVICIFAAKAIFQFKKKWLVTAIAVLTIVFSLYISYDSITMQSTAYKEVSDFITASGADKIINSHQGMYMYYLDDGIGRDNLYRLQFVNTIGQLTELYNEGYDYIILDERGYDAPLRELLLDKEPVLQVENPAWSKDMLIKQEYALVPFMTETDKQEKPWVGLRDADDSSYGYIYVYEIKTLI